ncbi:hypothetical protein [Bacillus sp. SG-1]|uniref:hypothetical protein n=1 Tax=Bacillus sp. SG-1 TaxID=161544 RepID=UPI0005C6359A|nr:hypothetical protein [Bacillus sp. SG-1]
MQRTIIGGFFFLGGLIFAGSIIIAGSVFATSITSWSGDSKLWFAIFGDKQYGDEVVQSLFLGFPFILSILIALIGAAMLGYEYYLTFKRLFS